MTPAPEQRTGADRWVGWLASPTWLMLVAFLMTTLLMLSMFNPRFGTDASVWPHQVLQSAAGFAWGPAQAKLVTLAIALATLVIALLMRPSRTRGLIAAFGAGLGLTAFQIEPRYLSFWILPVASALVGGCLMLPAETGGTARRKTLLVALAILGGNLFMPWGTERLAQHRLPPTYHCTALAQVDLLLNPPEEYLYEAGVGDEQIATPVSGYVRVLLMSLPQLVGVLVFVLGIVAVFLGAAGWLRWLTGLALLCLALGPAWVLYDHGSMLVSDEGPEPWQAGLTYWCGAWQTHSGAWVLALAAGVADLTRDRRD
ncbi:MAG: hypothetical protein O2894_11030 [Planctomycetota bacterium]|nr:hypothetical protein [Planctomycetota bacterium]